MDGKIISLIGIMCSSFRPITRTEAMGRWNKLDGKQRQKKTYFHYPGRKHTSLTGFEIQKMYQTE